MESALFATAMVVSWLTAYYVGFLTGQLFKAEPLAHWLAGMWGKK